MTEVFRKYPETTPEEERKGSPVCVVSRPDAGGPCERLAIGEGWSVPFCGLHGREAELAARQEMATSLEGIFTGLVAVEQERHGRNETAVDIIEKAAQGFSFDTLAYEAAIAAAYPVEELEANTDSDTLRYMLSASATIMGSGLSQLPPLRGSDPSPSGSLLKPAADQQVQSSYNGQDAYYREHCDYPEEHS